MVLFVFKLETRNGLSAPSHGLMVSAEILLQYHNPPLFNGSRPVSYFEAMGSQIALVEYNELVFSTRRVVYFVSFTRLR